MRSVKAMAPKRAPLQLEILALRHQCEPARRALTQQSRATGDAVLVSWLWMAPDPQSELAPISEAVTHDIRVEVLCRHAPENSRPQQGEWVFQYTVRITNQGTETVQLLSRHWVITDAEEHIEEVKGPGVVGEQPVIAPGESFKYSSWCPLKTPTGTMRGTYQMIGANGEQFDIEIAPFALKARYTVH